MLLYCHGFSKLIRVKILIRSATEGRPQTDATEQDDGPNNNGGVSLSLGQNQWHNSAHRDTSANTHDADFRFLNKTYPGKINGKHDGKENTSRGAFYPSEPSPYPANEDWASPYSPELEKPYFARLDQRTITINNITDRTTHKDLAAIIRGGMVLDMYIRPQERCANISFLDGAAAKAFMSHVKRHDVYLHDRRLEFSWSERQYTLSHHVARKIQGGASRNFLMRNVHPNITEEGIRDDLEHIHNLAVLDIKFTSTDCLISVNSVNNALFAKTCMMSRAKYKGHRFDFYEDECAQPIPIPVVQKQRQERVGPTSKTLNPMANRFQMLNMEGTEANSSGESDNESNST